MFCDFFTSKVSHIDNSLVNLGAAGVKVIIQGIKFFLGLIVALIIFKMQSSQLYVQNVYLRYLQHRNIN